MLELAEFHVNGDSVMWQDFYVLPCLSAVCVFVKWQDLSRMHVVHLALPINSSMLLGDSGMDLVDYPWVEEDPCAASAGAHW